ncbi:MAG TPA: type II toxin-antitoxin system VapC family toxin [Methylomirabilota bacterium]|nr:type II toxin-antitoxin system VapC family toxin [Methylomirabilota bacterium]
MSLYIDTSSFVRLLEEQSESAAVAEVLESETEVFVSDLVELETICHLSALRFGGSLSGGEFLKRVQMINQLLGTEPFVRRTTSDEAVKEATRQAVTSRVHCRSLDRLHLGAMVEFGASRLLTYDKQQARAAEELGFKVNLL